MITKAKGDSVRHKLISLSKKLAVKYADFETAFMIERLVARLMASKDLAGHLVFKGGFVCLKIYESNRYTVDLDAIIVKSKIDRILEQIKTQAETDLDDGVWFKFEDQIDLVTQSEYGGVRHSYRAGIGPILKNIKMAQVIHFDLGIGDPITPPPKKIQTKSYLAENGEISWLVYPIETICAEKLHALVTHGDQNSRSKDVYDLITFLPKTNLPTLKEAIHHCFDYRSTEVPESILTVLQNLDTDILARGWSHAVGSIREVLSFSDAYTKLLELIKDIESK